MIINRVFAPPSHETFTIKPIKELICRYIKNNQAMWIDPFAGRNSPAGITNDLDPSMPTLYHLEASDFCKEVCDTTSYSIYDGVLIDPPYSYRQITEHYKSHGVKASYKDTSYNFYSRVYNVIAPKIKQGGYAITCGWNSNGIGKVRGFEIVEILLVAHGLHHNDTIITVEIKMD